MSTTYRAATESDLDPLYEVLGPAFRFTPTSWASFVAKVGADAMRLLTSEDGQAVGGLARYAMGQWFGGRRLPAACVATVAVRPEARRTGAARTLMSELLRELRREGVALSALYASTSRLYRAVGYEQAGASCVLRQPLRLIGVEERTLPVRRLAVEDALGVLAPLYEAHARRNPGHLDRSELMWGMVLDQEEGPRHVYVVGPERAPEGYAVVRHAEAEGGAYDLAVRDLVALTGGAARRLWTLFADHAPIAGEVRWFGPPVEPLLALLPEQDHRVSRLESWLLRLVDVPAALAGRGYPEGVTGALHLEVEDDLLPENAGRWVLEVAEGRGAVRPGGAGTLRVDARALAPLFTGYLTATQLATSGRLAGSSEALTAADRLFAGPSPWMPDRF